MNELSPATKAVLTAFRERLSSPHHWQEACLAAALTALAVRIKGADDIRQDIFDTLLKQCSMPSTKNSMKPLGT
jgi:hypothetical protein